MHLTMSIAHPYLKVSCDEVLVNTEQSQLKIDAMLYIVCIANPTFSSKDGYELISEALNLLNNVYGAMHPEIAQVCLPL